MSADDLMYLSREPLNAELRPDRIRADVTPAGLHYVRNHFPIPAPPSRLVVGGEVEKPIELTLEQVRAMPRRSMVVTLECAGNGRAYLDPPAPGEQWHLGAVGTAEWTGARLRDVLDLVRPRPEAAEVLFIGADVGTPKDLGRQIAFERSLPIADARTDDPVLAYEMNGEPLPREHGAPLRLVVPRWYGMASVKWLAEIRVIATAFSGFFQSDRYVIDGRPLRTIAPRAIVTDPADGARVGRGRLNVRGRAWSGRAPIETVQASADNGYSWHAASLGRARSAHAWRAWEVTLETGDLRELEIMAFAVTSEGEQQPTRPVRNALGYSNNAARPVRVVVE